MKITCSACGKSHKSNAKLEASLEKLQPGQKLRLKCSQCGESIPLGRESLMKAPSSTSKLSPPPAPDTSWLQDGVFDDEEVVSDIPQAIVLMPSGEACDNVGSALSGLGYRAEVTDDPAQVLERMQFINYTCMVMHTDAQPEELDSNRLHRYICSLEMSRRRNIFYVLIGSNFKTFYNIQALSCSANLVVNQKDAPYFAVILRKAIPEYEELFGPYMDELKIQGK
jgi:hypothetical protein